MRTFLSHQDYSSMVSEFNKSFDETSCDEYWSCFKDLQKSISNDKCPICEVELTNNPNKTNTATLDHFRPKKVDKYPFLKCDPENYLLMCHLCNSNYKEDKFPLFDESKRATKKSLYSVQTNPGYSLERKKTLNEKDCAFGGTLTFIVSIIGS